MQNSSASKLIKFVFCICITILGVFMTFFQKGSDQNEKENVSEISVIEMESKEENNVFEHAENTLQLPDTENMSEDERYYSGMDVELYFSNTAVIDQGNLPLEVHAVLVKSAQKYLNRSGYEDVSELYIDEESYVEEDTYIAFSCYMDGHAEKLRIEFDFNESNLKFSIVE